MADDLDVAGLSLHPTSAQPDSNGGAQRPDARATSSSGTTAAVSKPTGPIPMTMPSILRNPRTSSNHHLSYLVNHASSYPPAAPRNTRSRHGGGGNSKELGRRKQRRSENERLLTSSASRPTLKDYRLHSNSIRSTFTPTTSSGAGKSVPVPSSSKAGYSEPHHDAVQASQGHFGKSLRDAQRVLKRLEMGNISDGMIEQGKAGELERFIWLVERRIRTWSEGDVFVFNAPSSSNRIGKVLLDQEFRFTRPPLGTSEDQELPTIELDSVTSGGGEGGQLVEFQRTPNALVWLVHDPFLRLIVHCLARVSKCPSFSKDDTRRPGLRFTWILNPNPLARRGRRGRRVSVSSSAISSVDAAPPPRHGNGVPRPPAHAAAAAAAAAGALETPPTTDFDSQTETESEFDTDVGESLAGSTVLVAAQPPGEEAEASHAAAREAAEAVDTDEEEAEILNRVRRWAIDSHRQRARQAQQGRDADVRDRSAQASQRHSSTVPAQQDPDQTLTGTAIAEADELDQEDDAEAETDSDDGDVRSF